MLLGQAKHFTVSAPFDRVVFAFALYFVQRQIFQDHFTAVGEQYRQLDDVIQSFAVGERVGAGGIVADHAADGGAIGSRGVGAELQPHRPNVSVELVLHQSRLDAAPKLFFVHLQNILHVFGKIENDRMSHRLPGQ